MIKSAYYGGNSRVKSSYKTVASFFCPGKSFGFGFAGVNGCCFAGPNDKIEKKDSNTKVFSLPELILPIKGEIFSNRKRLERV